MKDFIDQMKEVLEIEDFEIKPEDIFREYEEWDSLAVLSVLAMINEEYNVIIDRNKFNEINTIEELWKLIKKTEKEQ